MNANPEIEFVTGDITLESSDAIVDPAGAGLVDLAIRRAAGPALVEELHRNLAERGDRLLPPGEAIVTRGFGLRAPHVIHCGTPVAFDGPARAADDLAACHVESVRLARARGFASVSFPAIGTGSFPCPAREDVEVALRAVVAELRANGGPRRVRFVLPDDACRDCYASVGARLAPGLTRAAA